VVDASAVVVVGSTVVDTNVVVGSSGRVVVVVSSVVVGSVLEASLVVVSSSMVVVYFVASNVEVGPAPDVDTRVVESDAVSASERVAVDKPLSADSVVEDSIAVVVVTREEPDDEGLHGEASASWHNAKS